MTRGRATTPDLHERFQAWLRGGASNDPPRDAAVHAANCAACQRSIAAIDRLLLVDTGRAPIPPSRATAPAGSFDVRGVRVLAAAAAGFVIVASGAWIGIRALAPDAVGGAPGSATPDQAVLGGIGAGATPTPVAPGSDSASGAASPTADDASPTPDPTPSATVPGPAASPPVIPATARPSLATATPEPTRSADATARPSRTASPSATAPPPTAKPTPTPSPVTTPPSATPPQTADASASAATGSD